MRIGQAPSSADEGGLAPSRTLSPVAPRAIATGSNSAAAYHSGATRQRTIRRTRIITAALPPVSARTTTAAKKGPKPTMGLGESPKAYRGQGHYENA